MAATALAIVPICLLVFLAGGASPLASPAAGQAAGAAAQQPPPANPNQPPAASGRGAATQQNPSNAEAIFVDTSPLILTIDPKVDEDILAGVSVQNKSGKASLTPAASLSEIGLLDQAGKPIKLSTALTISQPVRPLATGDTAHLILRWTQKPKKEPRAGTYDGNLILSLKGKEVGRRPIQVVIPEMESAIVPATAKLNLRAYRVFPLIGSFWIPKFDSFSPGLPLTAPASASKAELAKYPLLGALTRDPVGSTLVYWDQQREEQLKADPPMLFLRLGSIPFAGKYDGTLFSGNNKVTVTLTATDFVIYPAACLLIVIWASIWGKDYLNGGRQFLVWNQRLGSASDAQQKAHAEFRRIVRGPAENYSIQDDFSQEIQAVLTSITRLRETFAGTLDSSNVTFQAIETQIAALEAAPNNWVLFAKQLDALEAVRQTVAGVRAPAGLEPQPAMAVQIGTMLAGRDLLLADVSDLQKGVIAMTAFVPQWLAQWTRAGTINEGMQDFVKTNAAFAAAHATDVTHVVQLLAPV